MHARSALSVPLPDLLVAGLASEERGRLAALFSRRVCPSGVEILRQGKPCDALYLVESGTLQVSTAQQGVVARVGPGECLGEVSLLTGEPASATVTALTEAVFWDAPQSEIRSLLHELPALAGNFGRLLAHRLSARTARRRERQVALLLNGAEAGGPLPGSGLVVNLAASLVYHLHDRVAVVDLCTPALSTSGGEPAWERPLAARRPDLPELSVVRAAGATPERLHALVETLATEYRAVLIWAPEEAAERLEPLRALSNRCLLTIPYDSCRAECGRRLPGSMAPELVVLGAPGAHTLAAQELIEGVTGLPVTALLPAAPQSLKQGATAAPDWVLQYPEGPFARGLARLARRLAGKSVGVALGAGAARGHGHIWVLRALERLGVYPDLLVGASIGGSVAGFYASQIPFQEIETAMQRSGAVVGRWALSPHSLLSREAFDHAFRSALSPDLRVEDLSPPCAFVATDFQTGEEVVLRRGNLWQSSRASASIPGIFPPMSLDGRLLIDGAVVSPVPCRATRALGADVVLGVSLEGPYGAEGGRSATDRDPSAARANAGGRKPSWPAVLFRAYDLLQRRLTQNCLQEADVPIRVFSPAVAPNDYSGGPRFVEAAERAVEAAGEQMRAVLPWLRP